MVTSLEDKVWKKGLSVTVRRQRHGNWTCFSFLPQDERENLVHPLINEPHRNFQSSICLPDKHHVEFSLSARWQTPLSSALQGIITNSWGGRLFSNPKGSGDGPTVCYYLLCSRREPWASVPDHPLTITESLFATHRPSQLPYRTVTHVCYLKAAMVMEDTRFRGSYSNTKLVFLVLLKQYNGVWENSRKWPSSCYPDFSHWYQTLQLRRHLQDVSCCFQSSFWKSSVCR